MFENRILALQFHLEATADFVGLVASNFDGEPLSPWVQSASHIRSGINHLKPGNQAMVRLLESLLGR